MAAGRTCSPLTIGAASSRRSRRLKLAIMRPSRAACWLGSGVNSPSREARLRADGCSEALLRRILRPAEERIAASGVRTPARIYDLRSTFASNALAAGVSVFQLARVMGTSVRMIERHYGALLDGSGAEIASRLDALDAAREREDQGERAADV
jgi:integrase